MYPSHGQGDTLAFAEEYSKSLKPGDVVALYGDLGAGKTVFCKGVAKGLGIEEEVLSPTYAYLCAYGDRLYHMDCYRLSDGETAQGMGLADYFYAGGICLVEWPQNIASVLPENCKTVTIEKGEGDERIITYDEP